MRKLLTRKKKNNSPDTEFEIQNYKKTEDNKYTKDGDPYQGIKESSIIEDIEINKNDIYRTLNTDNTFTEVKVEGKDKKYLSSINNNTKLDNITSLKEY
jgi:hypothetical protein